MDPLLDDSKKSHVVDGDQAKQTGDVLKGHPLVGPNKPFTFNYPIAGVPTAFAVTHHANQLTVIISQTGAIGLVLHAESDATAGLASLESTTYTVKTLLGPRGAESDGAVALARRAIAAMTVASVTASRPVKSLCLTLGLRGELSLPAAKEIYGVLEDCGAW